MDFAASSPSPRWKFITLCVWFAWSEASHAEAAHVTPTKILTPPLSPSFLLHDLRGGSSSSPSSKKGPSKKKKRKKKATGSRTPTGEEKKVIGEAMREKDAATALGDAIRDRADLLMADTENPLLVKIDQSVASVGHAMGTDARSTKDNQEEEEEDDDDGGGVEASPASVLANYFLKSHGGAHALQCVCSLFAVVSTLGALILPATSPMRLMFMKRAMLFAMIKHMSGLLAATSMAATAIPEIGLRQSRMWMEKLAKDPVSQYVFYAALILLWLPADATTTPWWALSSVTKSLAPFILVGPILLREAVSTAFVVSDVLVLLSTSAGREATPIVLRMSQGIMNAVMSLLMTPKVWRSADAPARQAILAKLVSRTSLALELLVGALLVVDGLMAVWEMFFSSSSIERPHSLVLAKRMLCARLYVNFLSVRRQKIAKLGAEIRGGAAQVPMRVLDALIDPRTVMGLDKATRADPTEGHPLTWKDYIAIGLDLESND